MRSNDSDRDHAEGPEPKQGPYGESLRLLSTAEELIRRFFDLAGMAWGLVADASRFGKEVLRFFRRNPASATAAGFTAVASASLAGGLVSGQLAGSTVKISAPVAVLPVAIVALLRIIGAAGKGGGEIIDAHSHGPALQQEAGKRGRLNTEAVRRGLKELLDARSFVGHYLAERAFRLRIGGWEGGLMLVHLSRRHHAREIWSSNSVPTAAPEILALRWEELGDVGPALDETMRACERQHAAVSFTLGGHRYLLAAVVVAGVDADLELEVSRTATGLAERHVHGVDGDLTPRSRAEIAPAPRLQDKGIQEAA